MILVASIESPPNSRNLSLIPIGLITNTSNLSVSQLHNLNVTANDSLGNQASGIFWINVTPEAVIDTIAPNITLQAPANNSIWNTSSSVTFIYNVTDLNTVDNCSLIINNEVNGTVDTTITKGVNQSFSRTLNNADYNWSVNCTDNSNNIGNSFTYNLTVNFIPSAIVLRKPSCILMVLYDNPTLPHIARWGC